MRIITSPIKCQGIKTKLVPQIQKLIASPFSGRFVEPFCGSCVVALNIQPQRALLADTNAHIIAFYQAVQQGTITPEIVRAYLSQESKQLKKDGEAHYYAVRERFNRQHDPLDLLFLSRAGFNGVMRFNSKGDFNVPFCRKPQRFSPAYITKITNQVSDFVAVLHGKDWQFSVADFRTTLAAITPDDVVYADPPYAGRHVDYYQHWRDRDEDDLVELLRRLPGRFVLSTWQQNQYRENLSLARYWHDPRYFIVSIEHFYHVGATEDLRHAMTEALIANVGQHAEVLTHADVPVQRAVQQAAFDFAIP